MESSINNLKVHVTKKKKLDRFLQDHHLWNIRNNMHSQHLSCLASSAFTCCQNRFPYLTSFFYYYYAFSFISWNDTLLSLKWGFMPSSVHFSVKSMAHDSGTLCWSCANQMNSLKAWWHLWIGNSLKAQPSVLFLTTFSLWDFSVLPDETSRTHYLQNNV